MFESLISISGAVHCDRSPPYCAPDSVNFSLKESNGFSREKWSKAHRDNVIHIYPDAPQNDYGFDEETCRALGMDVHKWRDVHGE